MAAQIKQQNPNASGRDVMAALNAMQSVMNQQNKQDFENLKLNMQNQQKEDSLAERERNDEARNKAYQENADTNRQRADTYDKAVDERNSRALDNIKIKLDAAKAKKIIHRVWRKPRLGKRDQGRGNSKCVPCRM